MQDIQLLPFLYSMVAIIGGAGYFPQIISLARTKTKARSVSLITWFIWLSTWLISLSYGILYLYDWRFCLIAAVNILGHLIVIGLVCHRRYNFLETTTVNSDWEMEHQPIPVKISN